MPTDLARLNSAEAGRLANGHWARTENETCDINVSITIGCENRLNLQNAMVAKEELLS